MNDKTKKPCPKCVRKKTAKVEPVLSVARVMSAKAAASMENKNIK